MVCCRYFFTANQPNTIHDILKHYIKYLVVFFILVNFYQTERQFKIRRIIALSRLYFRLAEWSFLRDGGHPLRFVRLQGDVNQLSRICHYPWNRPDARLIVSAGGLPEKVLLSLVFIWTVCRPC